jgi:hypothetical protein
MATGDSPVRVVIDQATGLQREARSDAKIVIRGAFPAGATVYLIPRVGDTFAGGTPEKQKKATKLGEVEFTGLDEGKPYWVAAQVDDVWRPRAAVAKVQTQVVDPNAEQLAAIDPTNPEHQRQLRSQREDSIIVSGVRDTKNTKRFRGHAKPAEVDGFTDKKLGTDEVADFPSATSRGEIVHPLEHAPKGVVLESDTLTGQAIPQRHRLQQEEMPKGVVQESDTPLGDATPLPGELSKVEGKKARGPEEEEDNAAQIREQELKLAPKRIKAAVEREEELTEARKTAAFPPPQSDGHGLVPGEARGEGPVEPQEGEPGYVDADDDYRDGDTTLPPIESPAAATQRQQDAQARSDAAKKAAETRKANEASQKRSAAAKKAARTRAKKSSGSSQKSKGATTAKKK